MLLRVRLTAEVGHTDQHAGGVGPLLPNGPGFPMLVLNDAQCTPLGAQPGAGWGSPLERYPSHPTERLQTGRSGNIMPVGSSLASRGTGRAGCGPVGISAARHRHERHPAHHLVTPASHTGNAYAQRRSSRARPCAVEARPLWPHRDRECPERDRPPGAGEAAAHSRPQGRAWAMIPPNGLAGPIERGERPCCPATTSRRALVGRC